ncbi:deoxyribonuclease-2-alpha-like [Babylonia areolata]|uniref:deoxyribonuclease-2-alpha-like n=1 Tax=Babylonia areolata TaxID=304850 RepID=UPI003FD6B896
MWTKAAVGAPFLALLLLLILAVCLLPSSASTVQCRGQKGEPVDWFIVYKLPKMRHQKGTEFGDGHAMFYMDGGSPTWTLSPNPINTTGQAVYYTLQQIYAAKEKSLLYLMFNDEKPSGSTSLSHGHTKGTLGFNNASGFWLIHSAPKFPPEKKDGYSWAENASDYGQSFLCMSFASKSLGILAKQLLFYYPYVYDYYLPPPALQSFPELACLVNSTRIQHPPYHSVCHNLTSLGGLPLVSFAKFTYFGADLYDALVAPTLKVSLLVETWQRGKESIVLPSNCSTPYEVFNIMQVLLPENRFFDEDKDHSKYALSLTDEGWVCVGGINRETKQFKRGGGTLCFQNPQVWSTYKKMVTFFEPCQHPDVV